MTDYEQRAIEALTRLDIARAQVYATLVNLTGRRLEISPGTQQELLGACTWNGSGYSMQPDVADALHITGTRDVRPQ